MKDYISRFEKGRIFHIDDFRHFQKEDRLIRHIINCIKRPKMVNSDYKVVFGGDLVCQVKTKRTYAKISVVKSVFK